MPKLTVVQDGASASTPTPRAKPKTVAEAAATGTHRELLVATRDRIARTVSSDECPPRDLAALSRQLVLLAKEIEAIDLAEKVEAERSGPVLDDGFDASAV